MNCFEIPITSYISKNYGIWLSNVCLWSLSTISGVTLSWIMFHHNIYVRIFHLIAYLTLILHKSNISYLILSTISGMTIRRFLPFNLHNNSLFVEIKFKTCSRFICRRHVGIFHKNAQFPYAVPSVVTIRDILIRTSLF